MTGSWYTRRVSEFYNSLQYSAYKILPKWHGRRFAMGNCQSDWISYCGECYLLIIAHCSWSQFDCGEGHASTFVSGNGIVITETAILKSWSQILQVSFSYIDCPVESSGLNCPRNHQGVNLVVFCKLHVNQTNQQHGLDDAESRGILSHQISSILAFRHCQYPTFLKT